MQENTLFKVINLDNFFCNAKEILCLNSQSCSLFCCTFLYVHSSFAIFLMGKRESWLLCLVCLLGVS